MKRHDVNQECSVSERNVQPSETAETTGHIVDISYNPPTQGRNCSNCGLWKRWSSFGLKVGGLNGRNSQCKNCRKKRVARIRNAIKLSAAGNLKRRSHLIELGTTKESVGISTVASIESLLRDFAFEVILGD